MKIIDQFSLYLNSNIENVAELKEIENVLRDNYQRCHRQSILYYSGFLLLCLIWAFIKTSIIIKLQLFGVQIDQPKAIESILLVASSISFYMYMSFEMNGSIIRPLLYQLYQIRFPTLSKTEVIYLLEIPTFVNTEALFTKQLINRSKIIGVLTLIPIFILLIILLIGPVVFFVWVSIDLFQEIGNGILILVPYFLAFVSLRCIIFIIQLYAYGIDLRTRKVQE